MKTILSAVSLMLATTLPAVAGASELKPLEAGTFELGKQTVSVYYTVDGDTYEVVATIAPSSPSGGAPIRFVGFLEPGQQALVSTGSFETTDAPDTLQLVHDGSILLATQVTAVAVAD